MRPSSSAKNGNDFSISSVSLANSSSTIWIATPVLEAVLDDIVNRISPGVISSRFHRAVQECIVRTSERFSDEAGTRHVALCGGVFMNRVVLGGTIRLLHEAGLEPLTHRQLPVNDAAVSYGQAIIARALRHEL